MIKIEGLMIKLSAACDQMAEGLRRAFQPLMEFARTWGGSTAAAAPYRVKKGRGQRRNRRRKTGSGSS